MKRTLPLLALLASQALALENAIPAAFPADRYEKMVEASLFALATPVAPVAAPQANFAANLFLTAAGRDPQGQDFVTIKAQDNSVHFSLFGRDSNPETGISLASVDWSDTFRKTTAIVKKGTETAKLIFSQEEAAVVAPQPAGARPPGSPPLPVTVRQGGGGPPQTPVVQPRIALPRPTTMPVVTQPPQPVVQPGQPAGTPPGGPTSTENRRRIRNIPAPQ